MMGVWSDENLKDFFLKKEISLKKKPPPVEKKLSPTEPVKNGLPSLKSIFKRDKKVDPKPIYYNRLTYVVAGMKNTFFDDSFDDMDKEIPGGVAHQGYNPGSYSESRNFYLGYKFRPFWKPTLVLSLFFFSLFRKKNLNLKPWVV